MRVDARARLRNEQGVRQGIPGWEEQPRNVCDNTKGQTMAYMDYRIALQS
jgi:hypothetical protein